MPVEDFERRVRACLTLTLPDNAFDVTSDQVRADHHIRDRDPTRPWRPAAVLMPVVARPEGASMLLTLRTASLRDHSGQIAFPGGKIDPQDESPLAAALREAEEEIGLDRARVTPLGYLQPYSTGTGFIIVPTVALVHEPFALTLNESEVAEAFEVPLGFLMEATNHERRSRELNGAIRHFYAMPYGDRLIWGITAGLIRNLYERLYL